MKALAKYKFYLMILSTAVFFAVGTVESDNRTVLSTGETKQMVNKPTIMILGSPHLAGWGGIEVDDMRTHGQEHFLSLPANEDALVTKENLVDELIIDMYIRLNQPEWIHSIHKEFLRYSRIGLGDEYPGADWFGHFWYPRNIKTFVNLTRITESADDRILLVIGAGHTYLIQQFLEDSEDYIIESPLKYLDNEGM